MDTKIGALVQREIEAAARYGKGQVRDIPSQARLEDMIDLDAWEKGFAFTPTFLSSQQWDRTAATYQPR